MSGSSTDIIDACTYKLPSCSVQQHHFLCCIIFVFWFLLAPKQKSVVFSYCEYRKILLTLVFLNTLGLGRRAGSCRRCWSPDSWLTSLLMFSWFILVLNEMGALRCESWITTLALPHGMSCSIRLARRMTSLTNCTPAFMYRCEQFWPHPRDIPSLALKCDLTLE